MEVIFNIAGKAPVRQTATRATCLSVGVGAHRKHRYHVACYITSTGSWGAFGIAETPSSPHTCTSCDVKTELLALALGLGSEPGPFARTIIVPASYGTTRILALLKRDELVPSWEYSGVVGDLPGQIDRLLASNWDFNTPMQPALAARDVAMAMATNLATAGLEGAPNQESLGSYNPAILAAFLESQ